jgi:hypothetical protein
MNSLQFQIKMVSVNRRILTIQPSFDRLVE